MTAYAGVVLSVLAAVLYAIGFVLYPAELEGVPVLRALFVPVIAAPVFMVLGQTLTRLLPLARLMAAVWPPVTIAVAVTGAGDLRESYISTVGLWAFGTAALGAGLALMPRDDQPLATLALFPLGAALASGVVTLATLGLPAISALLAATPYHFVIVLVGCAVAVALLDASSALPPARERLIRALIGLMPLLGFLGTIAGIIEALANLPALFADGGAESGVLALVMRGLSTAFETTLLGLVGASAASFVLILLVDRAKPAP